MNAELTAWPSVQFYEGQALADDNDNRRNAIETYSSPLGNIIVAGKAVTGSARTTDSDLAYKRTYTNGRLYAAVTGYASQAYAPTQLEGIYADLLNGTDSRLKTVMLGSISWGSYPSSRHQVGLCQTSPVARFTSNMPVCA